MDFNAFKRSKALQSPVCLLGWNSKGTSVPVARGSRAAWLSLNWAVPRSAHTRRGIDWGGLNTLLIKCAQGRAVQGLTCSVPKAEQPSLLHRLLRGAAAHPSETGGKVQGRGRSSLPANAAVSACKARGQFQPGACALNFCVTANGCFWKRLGMTGKRAGFDN